MTNIYCRTVPTGLKNGEKPVNRFVVVHNGTASEEHVYGGISSKSGMPFAMVKATGTMIFGEIGELLSHGYRVELPEMSAFLAIPGMVESASDESLRTTPLAPTVHLVAKGAFKKCCQGPEFSVENITKGATVVVDGVIDAVSKTPGVVTNGLNVEVHVTGRGLYMPDLSDPTVGAYIASADGKVLVKADVSESTVATLVCTFPQINLQEGVYKFAVASRNGLDPTQYGVTVGTRNINVVGAVNATDEESGV